MVVLPDPEGAEKIIILPWKGMFGLMGRCVWWNAAKVISIGNKKKAKNSRVAARLENSIVEKYQTP